MEKVENKFFVINRKRFKEIKDADDGTFGLLIPNAIDRVNESTRDFAKLYEYVTGKSMDQMYWVCNQDEPYAEDIKKIILTNGEYIKSLQSKLEKAVELLTPFAHCKCDCGECHNCLADKFISDIKALQSGADARGE